ncbi:ubiquinol-cytochrome c reductase iron-sulfur subunit [Cupriavidus pinatubonensis]|uniref:ubiquinol-cytochrome c reductase iron-sulfur subunit n=1 Tax=Cupriavidus pinatubonensis TaxID=248026 RepID=UPI00112C77C9|nr:ubiquinol-cytochrome c reductase iron-sulfur subunit [Cupriavidus pinatubonensis]TPQ31734.1 ubiquinol-cytochrome c reductase iron-sulfur subunit [Cupriavidus pinatubonensis]
MEQTAEVGCRAPESARRRWLVATATAGGIGCLATLVPFAEYFEPSERARAAGAPVTVDIRALKEGEAMTTAWRGMPVMIVRRTPDMLAQIPKCDALVADPQSRHPFSMPLPEYCRNEFRARASQPAILVVTAVCTHLGCTPLARLRAGPQPGLPDDWPGGFFCPCHGSTYDLAGRVFKDKPAPQNLDVPRFVFSPPDVVTIGQDEQGEA